MADQLKVSAAIVAESEERSEERSYVFKVHGYSTLKELFKKDECVASPPFNVGGDNWVLRYYPNSRLEDDPTSRVHLVCDSADDKAVNAKARSISVLDRDGVPVPPHPEGMIQRDDLFEAINFRSLGLILNLEQLEEWGLIVDDCFSIKCVLAFKKDIHS
jgi:hypothetical protein